MCIRDRLMTLMGRKTDSPALREPAAAASRWGRSVYTGPGVSRLNRSVGRDGRHRYPPDPLLGMLRAAG